MECIEGMVAEFGTAENDIVLRNSTRKFQMNLANKT
jgi:hypothetical protein